MEQPAKNTYDLYRDIQLRTGGEIYLGIVGPVRTGKSTFIKRFMELLVLPSMETAEERNRAQDELPQSAGGKTITTTEPKFIPQKAAAVSLAGDIQVRVRLIDCVGFMVDGAAGHMEEGKERLVKTPWFEEAIPFTRAAEIGTQKVITDHSTLGLVVTTDGSIGELERNQYLEAEEHTINELKRFQKPFLVLVNSSRPYSEEALRTVEEIQKKHDVAALAINCMQMKIEDIYRCLRTVLEEFPVSGMEFFVPKWVESLPNLHPLKADIIGRIRSYMEKIRKMKDVLQEETNLVGDFVTRCTCTEISMATGKVIFCLDVDERYYYDMLSELTGEELKSQYQLLELLKGYKSRKREYEKVLGAVAAVRSRGYGVVTPDREEILLEEPQVVRHGNKFGVKIKAESPSVHMIRANVVTEIAPIVGNEQQAYDLINYIKSERETEKGIWETNIFGKTVEQLIFDGIQNKIAGIGEDSQQNLQETMQKILNESKGGMIFILI